MATRNNNSQSAAFSNGGTTDTLRLLLDATQKAEIGLRIKELRDNSEETSRSIADYCDVSVEAVRNWIAGKGIAYDNAKKVAELFEVDETWLWRGTGQGETPDLMNGEPPWVGEFRELLTGLRSDLDDLRELVGQIAVARALAVSPQERSEAQPGTEEGSGSTQTQ